MSHDTLFKCMMYSIGIVFFLGSGFIIGNGLQSTSQQTVSGVSPEVMIDNQTGCHYLFRNSLTPRLDRDGKQICEVK